MKFGKELGSLIFSSQLSADFDNKTKTLTDGFMAIKNVDQLEKLILEHINEKAA